MTKVTKSERKWGKQSDIESDKPKVSTRSKEINTKPEIEMYKILIDGSGFSKAMTYEDCVKVMDDMEAKALRLRQHAPSLILVKQ